MCGSGSLWSCICNCSCNKGIMCFLHASRRQFFERLHHGTLDELSQKKIELERKVRENTELQNKIDHCENQKRIYNGYLDFYKSQLKQVESIALPCLEITKTKNHIFWWFDMDECEFNQIFTKPVDKLRKAINVWGSEFSEMMVALEHFQKSKMENESTIAIIENSINMIQLRIDEYEVELEELTNLQTKIDELAQNRNEELYFNSVEPIREDDIGLRSSRVKELKKAQHKDKVIHTIKQNELKMRNKPKFYEKSRDTSEQCQSKRRNRSRSIQRKQNVG